MSTRRPTPKATTDQELMREFNQRLRNLEGIRTVRLNDGWTLASVDGKPKLIRPGQAALEVGGEAAAEEITFSDRGTYVTPDELAEAVTGGEGGLDEVRKLFENLTGFLNGVNLNDPDFDPDDAANVFVTTVVQPLIDVLARLRKTSIGWLTDEPQNMVEDGGYDAPITIVEGSGFVHDATDGVPGSIPVGCAKVVADGADHQQAPRLFEVGKNWKLVAGSRVKWESLTTSGSNPIRIDIQPYLQTAPDTFVPVGSPVMVASVASPSGNSGGTGGWGTGPIQGTWQVPGDGTVSHVALIDHVTAAATSGAVKFDDTFMYPSQDIPQQFVNGLIDGLQSLYDWIENWVVTGLTALGIPATGGLADMINDLADGLSDVQNAAEDAWAGLAEKLGLDTWDDFLATLLTNPGSVLGMLGMNKITNLQDAFDDLGGIFDLDLSWVPTLPFGEKVQALINRFFGGGQEQVVTQNQVAEASGIPPMDADTKIPWVYLPPELTTAAIGHPWVELTKVGSQTINANTLTKLTVFTQAGGFPLTDSSSVFSVPFAGLFHVTIRATWANTPETTMRVILYKNGTQYRMDNRFGDPLGSVLGYNEVSEYVPLDAGDTIEFRVFWLGSGSTKDISVTNTYARITYIGATHLTSTPIPTPTVTFDAKGTADDGGGDLTWTHTFGANAKTIVIPISYENAATPVITCGAYSVPILSGPTYVGSFSGANSRYALAAAILPDAVKGTTQTVTVDLGSGNLAGSGNSLSFNDVSYIGAVRESSDSSGPAKLLVPSNAFSQVAGGFCGTKSNFSGFNRTQDNIWNFIAFNSWAHVIGHAQGGLEFQASGGRWAGKFVELHP